MEQPDAERRLALTRELLEIERCLWTRGADYYRDHVDAECLVALRGQTGLVDKEALAASVTDAPRWGNPFLRVRGLVEPTRDLAIVTYEASATRTDGKTYSALVSSAYVRRPDGWKLTFHQQTPIESA